MWSFIIRSSTCYICFRLWSSTCYICFPKCGHSLVFGFGPATCYICFGSYVLQLRLRPIFVCWSIYLIPAPVFVSSVSLSYFNRFCSNTNPPPTPPNRHAGGWHEVGRAGLEIDRSAKSINAFQHEHLKTQGWQSTLSRLLCVRNIRTPVRLPTLDTQVASVVACIC
jgi:hypothetical protein